MLKVTRSGFACCSTLQVADSPIHIQGEEMGWDNMEKARCGVELIQLHIIYAAVFSCYSMKSYSALSTVHLAMCSIWLQPQQPSSNHWLASRTWLLNEWTLSSRPDKTCHGNKMFSVQAWGFVFQSNYGSNFSGNERHFCWMLVDFHSSSFLFFFCTPTHVSMNISRAEPWFSSAPYVDWMWGACCHTYGCVCVCVCVCHDPRMGNPNPRPVANANGGSLAGLCVHRYHVMICWVCVVSFWLSSYVHHFLPPHQLFLSLELLLLQARISTH